jgi:hypothetical protein
MIKQRCLTIARPGVRHLQVSSSVATHVTGHAVHTWQVMNAPKSAEPSGYSASQASPQAESKQVNTQAENSWKESLAFAVSHSFLHVVSLEHSPHETQLSLLGVPTSQPDPVALPPVPLLLPATPVEEPPLPVVSLPPLPPWLELPPLPAFPVGEPEQSQVESFEPSSAQTW